MKPVVHMAHGIIFQETFWNLWSTWPNGPWHYFSRDFLRSVVHMALSIIFHESFYNLWSTWPTVLFFNCLSEISGPHGPLYYFSRGFLKPVVHMAHNHVSPLNCPILIWNIKNCINVEKKIARSPDRYTCLVSRMPIFVTILPNILKFML